MNKSESIKNLANALNLAQAEMPPASMNATNPFLKKKYADLGSVIETAKPILAAHGLSIAQFPTGDGSVIGVETILMHSSGEWVSNTQYLAANSEKGKSDAQVAGSIISYLRRYAFAAVLGMYADEDTDGIQPPAGKQPAQKKQPPAQPESAEAPALTPQYMVDNDLSSNVPHAAQIINGLKLAGQQVTPEALAKIKKYREFKDGGMDDKSAFAAVLSKE